MMTFATSLFEFDKNTRSFCAEASSCGLKPGQWPKVVNLVNDEGVEATFNVRLPIGVGGQFFGFRYTNASTLSVKIFND